VQYVAYDGNGNVSALVNAANGATVANYEYGPFGEVIRATGPMAKLNPFRFSTIYQDDESDLLMYVHRPYKASTGTWLCKDPLGEQGGLNLYAFVRNNSVNLIDCLGLLTTDDLEKMREKLEAELRKIACCCDKNEPASLKVHIKGSASGATVTENATLTQTGCLDKDFTYYWWDCFHAQHDFAAAGSPPGLDWHEYGWHSGGNSQTDTHKGWSPIWDYWDFDDASHWNWAVMVLYKYCGKDGHKHAGLARSNYEEWTWSMFSGWGDPHPGQ
jgi:RHS repeat-associated protein